jgi:hypothetical protein
MATTKKIPDGYLQDARGRLTPVDTVSEQDLRRDALAKELVSEALVLEELIASKRQSMQARVDAYLDWLKAEKKVRREKWKGNIQLDSYDGSMRIDRRVNEVLGFNETLQLAKTMLDEWFNEKLEDGDQDLRTAVMGAFNVDQKGRVNKSQILKILRYDIKDAKWKKAMALIREAMTILTSRQSTTFYVRTSSGEMRQVVLAFVSSEIQYDESAEREG